MISWRITKYNPKYRDEKGIYQKDEWTSRHDIGKLFDGKEFTVSDYLSVENAYIRAVLSFVTISDVETFIIKNLEKYGNNIEECPLVYTEEMIDLLTSSHEGKIYEIRNIESFCRLILREQLWCKLEYEDSFVHFGYDYYMYIGCTSEPKRIIHQIEKDGLYVEKMQSPYLD